MPQPTSATAPTWSATLRTHWLVIVAHVGALAPLALLIWDFSHNQLTVNPIQEATFRTGLYALVLLILSLACTPLNILTGWRAVLRLRKPLGLYAFGYAALHFIIFAVLDFGLNINLILQEISEKRYVLVGFAAFLILLALALTSFRFTMRWLGKNWKRLHQLVYLAALLGVAHFVWLVKSDIREPLAYGAVVALLLLIRVPRVRKAIITFRQRRFPPARRTA